MGQGALRKFPNRSSDDGIVKEEVVHESQSTFEQFPYRAGIGEGGFLNQCRRRRTEV
jgi:hypothetical protein